MRIGMVGLGRMGAGLTRRAAQGGHEVVAFDQDAAARTALADEPNVQTVSSLTELVAALPAPRSVWLMLPAGDITEAVLQVVAELLDPGDLVIEGGKTLVWEMVSELTSRSVSLDHLLIQVGFAGYTPNEGPSDVILPVMVGLQFDHPVGKPADQADQKMLHWHVAYWRFGNSLEFDSIVSDANDIRDQWEIGAALARRESPIRIWFLNFDRLGLGYRVSSDGALKGVTFIFRSLFDE